VLVVSGREWDTCWSCDAPVWAQAVVGARQQDLCNRVGTMDAVVELVVVGSMEQVVTQHAALQTHYGDSGETTRRPLPGSSTPVVGGWVGLDERQVAAAVGWRGV